MKLIENCMQNLVIIFHKVPPSPPLLGRTSARFKDEESVVERYFEEWDPRGPQVD
jgi:hypothetical protein